MTEREERAQRLHDSGYNCAQAVVCAYCDRFGLDENTAFKMAEGFGLGMGSHPGETKAQTYKLTKALAAAFEEKNGTYLCRELKGVTDGTVRRSCPGCISDACQLIEEYLLK